MRNRIHNCKNPFQGTDKKVLCVCSAGLLRSPTAARILCQEPYGFNTRAVGLDEGHALIPMDEVHYEWADEIVVMDYNQKRQIEQRYGETKPIVVLKIKDSYEYMEPFLVDLIKERYNDAKE